MVVLYFSIKQDENKKLSVREFSEYIKKSILVGDQKKVIGIDVILF